MPAALNFQRPTLTSNFQRKSQRDMRIHIRKPQLDRAITRQHRDFDLSHDRRPANRARIQTIAKGRHAPMLRDGVARNREKKSPTPRAGLPRIRALALQLRRLDGRCVRRSNAIFDGARFSLPENVRRLNGSEFLRVAQGHFGYRMMNTVWARLDERSAI